MMGSIKNIADASVIASEFTKEKDYWLNKLSGNLVKSYFTNFSRRAVVKEEGGYSAGTMVFKWKGELFSKLLKISNGSDVRLHIILLAGMMVLLKKYTGHGDIIIGAPIYRQHTECELINTVLALRNPVPDTMTFKELLLEINQTIGEAVENQNYPIEALLYQLNMQVSKDGFPLFDIALLLENIHDPQYLRHIPLNMVFIFKRTSGWIEGLLKYNSSLYDRNSLERIIGHLFNVLNDGISDVNKKILAMDILTQSQQKQLIYELNRTYAKYPNTKTIPMLLEEQVAQSSDHMALIDTAHKEGSRRVVSYSELDRKSDQLACRLKESGVVPNTIVALMMDQCWEMIIGILGILKAGGAYMPIDANYPVKRIQYMLNDSNTKWMVTTPGLSDKLEKLSVANYQLFILNKKGFEQGWLNIPSTEQKTIYNYPVIQLKASNLAYIIYTSGTTGQPKGVMINHRNVVRLLFNDQFPFEFDNHDVWTMFHSYCFDFSVWEMYGALLYGGKLILVPPMTARDPGKFLQVLEKEKVTILNQTPSAFYYLMEEEFKFSSRALKIRYIIFGGDILIMAKLRKWKDKYPITRLINMYGITETTVHVTYKEINDEDIELNINNIGKPIPTIRTYVMDDNLKLLPIGVAGEICIGGEGVAEGYLNRVELTGTKFVKNPGEFFEKLYRSGDLVRLLENGEMEYLGRIDQQVKIRGYRIEPGEIETQLLTCAGLKEVIVIDCQFNKEYDSPGEDNNNYLCAYFVASNEATLTTSQLKEWLAQKLPDYMIPSYFVQLEKIPLTVNGKIHREMLPGPQTAAAKDDWPPRNQVEEKLVKIWQKVLKTEKIGIKDSFFDRGGDSIKVIKLINLINSGLNTDLKIVDIYHHETIEKISGILSFKDTNIKNKELEKALEEVEELKNEILKENKLSWDLEDIEDIYPMSDVEKGMVYHSLKDPEEFIFHDQLVHQVRYKNFDPKRFKKALALLIEKHSVLRTSFNMNDFKEEVQIVHKKYPVDYQHIDISKRGKKQQEKYLIKFLEEDRKNPFDPKTVPLWRMRTFTLDQENVCIAWIFHHAILDGWSDASFKTELNNTYLTLKSNPGYVPEKLKNSYKEFVLDQIVAKKKKATIDFWRNELTDYKRLNLFAGEKNINEPVVKKAKIHHLGIPLRKRLTEVAFKHNTTVKNLFFGAYVYMLYMFSFENDMVVGLSSHNRPLCEDGEKILGCFLNTLPVRLDIPGNNKKTWSDYIGIIENKMLELLKYDHLSLFEIARLIGENAANHNPIFDTFFGFLDFFVYDQAMGEGKQVRMKTNEDKISIGGTTNTNTLLDFGIISMSDIFRITFSYTNSLLTDLEAEKLCLYFVKILNKMIEEPGSFANKDEIISPLEKKRILYNMNGGMASSQVDQTIDEIFRKQLPKRSDHVAVIGKCQERDGEQSRDGISLTYRELNNKSDQLVYLLKEKGLPSGAIVGIALKRSVELIIGLLGILKSGCAYLPIDPAYPQERIHYMLTDSSARFFLKGDLKPFNFNTPNDTDPCIVLDFLGLDFEFASNRPYQTTNIKYLDPAYVIYTSGTAGKPKGVVIEHGSVVGLVKKSNYITWDEVRSLAMTGSMAFDISTFEIWGPLLNGLCLYLMNDNAQLDPEKLGKIITENDISILHLTPLLFNQIATQNIEIFANLKYFLVGGDLVRPGYINRLRIKYKNLKILHMYGPTENTVFSTFFSINRTYEAKIPIGVPVNNTTVYIFDKGNHLQPEGIAGELCTGGDGLARGYLNNPGLTLEKFISNPFIKTKRLYKTGDLARWLQDANIEFLGRIDEQVKIRGIRIELREIEIQLLKHHQIEQTTVLAKEDKNGDKYLCAYIVEGEVHEKKSRDLTGKQQDQLRHYLSAFLPEYMIPSHFVKIGKIPLTGNGKLNIEALPKPGAVKPDEFIPVENPIEEKLVDLWSRVLEIEKKSIRINSNFFKLGGHSLKAIKLVTLMQKELKIKLSVEKVFDIPTIRGLARYIYSLKKIKYQKINLAEKKEYYELSSAQKRLYFLQQIDLNSIGYNMPLVLSVAKNIDIKKLEWVFKKLMTRHEMLRTAFIMKGEKPAQKIYDEIDFALEMIDLKKMMMSSSCSVEESIKGFIRAFDLSKAPLLRVRLIFNGEGDAILMMDFHHIITDGSAQLVMTKEFMKLNSGEPLPPIRIQYKDYSEWQNRLYARKDETLKIQEQYWLKRFEGQLPTLNIPCDYPRAAIVNFEGNSFGFTISRELTGKIKSLTLETGTTLFMVLLTVYNILLSKYTGQEDIVVGAPVTGRTHPDLQNLVGITVNMLPIRNYPRYNKTFGEFLAEVKENSLDGFNNQDYQLDMLISKLKISPDLSKHSLIDTVFVMQNIQKTKPNSSQYQIDYNISKFDLELSAEETQEEIYLNFDYRTQLFKKDTIEAMIRHFLNIVDEVITDTGIKISEIQMLDQNEQENLIETMENKKNQDIKQDGMIKINADFDF